VDQVLARIGLIHPSRKNRKLN